MPMSKIKSPSPKTRKRIWIITIFIILAVSGGYAYYMYGYQPSQEVTTESELQTATVRRGELVIYASGSGTLISANEASFGFGTSGQVVEVLVGVGDQVEAGQILAQLDDTSAQSNLKSVQREYLELTSPAAIATAEESLVNAQDTYDDAKRKVDNIGSRYADAETLEYLQAQLILASDTLERAKKRYDNMGGLDESDPSTARAATNLYDAQDAYDTALSSYNWYSAATPSESEIALANAELNSASAALQEAKWYLSALKGETIPENATGANLAALENARVALEDAQLNLETTQLVAPISGTVMSLDFSVGDVVGTSSVVTIADLGQPYLEVFLDESDWANITVGYPVEVTFDILPEKIFNGEVVQVDPGLYTSGNTTVVRALVQLDNSESFNLPLGTAASVDVIGGRAENAVLVPVEALHETSPGEYAVFVVEDGKPRLRVIEVGIKDLLYAEVKSGLEAGELVTTGITETQ